MRWGAIMNMKWIITGIGIFGMWLGNLTPLHAEGDAAAGTAADPDYIPPSNAIFSGLDTPTNNAINSTSPSSSSRQQLTESFGQATGTNKSNPTNPAGHAEGGETASRGSPLDVAPISAPESAGDRNGDGATAAGQPQQKITLPPGGLKLTVPDESKYPVIQIYDQEELITLINENQHLNRIAKIDECQLVKDIEVRARTVMIPAYQYAWGDMLLTGTCVTKNVEKGLEFVTASAKQGLPAGLLHLAKYYQQGIYVQKDARYAAILMHEAAGLGLVKAQVEWVGMLGKGLGSPLDYEEAYSWLHHAIIADDKQHRQAEQALRRLAQRMPPNIIERAKRYRWQ
jgi:hypothetical protein